MIGPLPHKKQEENTNIWKTFYSFIKYKGHFFMFANIYKVENEYRDNFCIPQKTHRKLYTKDREYISFYMQTVMLEGFTELDIYQDDQNKIW